MGTPFQLRSSLLYSGKDRKFFTTAKGRMSIGLRLTKPGDQVCLLFGGATPFAFCPAASGQYLFLGECFVDGLMRGEGF